jgi:hypothetical protein
MPESMVGMGQQDRAERERFENEVRRIVEAGTAASVTLRLLGSLAFQFHCPAMGWLQEKMGRAYTDIDFAGYGRESKNVRALMAGLGYSEDKEVWVVSEGGRAIFNHPGLKLHVDVFYEKLDFSHPLGDHDRETINMNRVAKLCSDEWGLWRTVTMNLKKVRQLAAGYAQLTEKQKNDVAIQVEGALAHLEASPKSMAWRIRARVGDRVKWYKDVDEVM